MDAIKKLFVGHVEKLLTVVFCGLSAWWLWMSVGELSENTARDTESNGHLEKVGKALVDKSIVTRSNYDYAGVPAAYDEMATEHIKATVAADPKDRDRLYVGRIDTNAEYVARARIFYGVPEKLKKKIVIADTGPEIIKITAKFGPPTELEASVDIGQVVLSLKEGAHRDEYAELVRIEFFKRAEGESAYPDTPWKVVAADAKPALELKSDPADPATTGRRRSRHDPFAGIPGGRPTPVVPRPAVPGAAKKIEGRSYMVDDSAVEPRKTYQYKARAVGKKVEKEDYEITMPAGLKKIAEGAEGEDELWVSAFTPEITVLALSDVKIEYRGDSETEPEWKRHKITKRLLKKYVNNNALLALNVKSDPGKALKPEEKKKIDALLDAARMAMAGHDYGTASKTLQEAWKLAGGAGKEIFLHKEIMSTHLRVKKLEVGYAFKGTFQITKYFPSADPVSISAAVAIGDLMNASKLAYVGGKTRRIDIDSGFRLLALIERTETEPKTARPFMMDEKGNPVLDINGIPMRKTVTVMVPKLVKVAIIEEVATGKRDTIGRRGRSTASGGSSRTRPKAHSGSGERESSSGSRRRRRSGRED